MSDIGSFGTFSNPIVGSGGELVREKITSDGYVPGTTGWKIAANGDVDFNEGTFRGSVDVEGPNNSRIYIASDATEPVIQFKAPDDLPRTFFPADIKVGSLLGSSFLQLDGPTLNGNPAGPVVKLISDPLGDTFYGRNFVGADSDLVDLDDQMPYRRGQLSASTPVVIGAAATSATLAVNFPTAFPVGVVPVMTPPNLTNTSVSSVNWFGRCTNITNTGFTLRLYGPAPGGTGFTAGCQWVAFVP